MTGGDDHPPELFSGDECATEPEPVEETDTFNAGRWSSTLSYREIHSFVLGFAPVALLLSLAVPFPAAVPVLLGIVLTVSVGGIWTAKVPEGRARRWLCKEPHYAWGGQVVGLLAGTPIYVLLGGV